MSCKFQTKVLSSLEKVFPDDNMQWKPLFNEASCLKGEIFSFQVACGSNELIRDLNVTVDELDDVKLQIREVGLVPGEFLGEHFDGDELKKSPGLFPDPLMPITGKIKTPPFQLRSFWVTVPVSEKQKPGDYEIKVRFSSKEKELDVCETFKLTVKDAVLPAQELTHTEWFHADCIATHYKTEMWSEKHWELLEKYIRNAAEHGINMILTPIFTPPLDTAVDGERPTTQLVDVERLDGEYTFEFSKLERWLDLLDKCGVKYVEFSHLFTQWGAKKTPKIVVKENGEEKKAFGWHVDACSPEYKELLDAFLPSLVEVINARNLKERCVFHVSDEPYDDHYESYGNAKAMLDKHLSDFKFIDALSKVDYYNKGLVTNPVPANNHIEPFVEAGVENLWTYYCCSQQKLVPNRFFHQPSSRNRIMGPLLYTYDLKGFLHWGFNFWYAQYSTHEIDPFKVTDSGRAFPSGDPFLVYPGSDGPIDSIRHEVVRESLQDLRAFKALESKEGRDKVVTLLEEKADMKLYMTQYPKEASYIQQIREEVNTLLTS